MLICFSWEFSRRRLKRQAGENSSVVMAVRSFEEVSMLKFYHGSPGRAKLWLSPSLFKPSEKEEVEASKVVVDGVPCGIRSFRGETKIYFESKPYPVCILDEGGVLLCRVPGVPEGRG